MRKTKFRAWHKGQGRMFPVWDLSWRVGGLDKTPCGEGPIFQKDGFDPEEAILIQFTGFYDKNGKEIYEGDILKSNRHKEPAIVEWWDTGSWNLTVKSKKHGKVGFPMTVDQDGVDADMKLRYRTIIGNIYEHPDPVKGAA